MANPIAFAGRLLYQSIKLIFRVIFILVGGTISAFLGYAIRVIDYHGYTQHVKIDE